MGVSLSAFVGEQGRRVRRAGIAVVVCGVLRCLEALEDRRVLPAGLPAVSGSASRVLTRWDLFGSPLWPIKTGYSECSALARTDYEAVIDRSASSEPDEPMTMFARCGQHGGLGRSVGIRQISHSRSTMRLQGGGRSPWRVIRSGGPWRSNPFTLWGTAGRVGQVRPSLDPEDPLDSP